MSKVFIGIMGLLVLSFLSTTNNPLKEDLIAHLAIKTVKMQASLPEDMEVKFVERRESSIPDFYMVKLLVTGLDKEIPIVVYVDKSDEKVILGSLFIKGENITLRETEEPPIRKIGAGKIETEKSWL